MRWRQRTLHQRSISVRAPRCTQPPITPPPPRLLLGAGGLEVFLADLADLRFVNGDDGPGSGVHKPRGSAPDRIPIRRVVGLVTGRVSDGVIARTPGGE